MVATFLGLSRRSFARGSLWGAAFAPLAVVQAAFGREAPDVLPKTETSAFHPPVGAVMQYAGIWPPMNPETEEPWREAELGWTLCDGTPIEVLEKEWGTVLKELRSALGSDRLPDARGCFTRTLDRDRHGKPAGRDPDRSANEPPGSLQGWATAIPDPNNAARRIRTNGAGAHDHNLPGNGLCVLHAPTTEGEGAVTPGTFDRSNGEIDIRNARAIPIDGGHDHWLAAGGDRETRPVNVALYTIIKCCG